MQQTLDQHLLMESLIYPVVVILVALVLTRLVLGLLRNRLHRMKPKENVWRHAVLSSLYAPVRALIWLVSLVLIKQKFIPAGVVPLVDKMFIPIVSILTIFLVTWFLLRVVDQAKNNYVAHITSLHNDVDRTALDAVSKLAWIFILIFALISILQQLHVPLASLLAFGGAAGIAVGFAAQTLVANLFGGLTVYASRIFKIGEEIIFPGTNLAGTVEQIGWRATRVLGWDGKPFYVPNSIFNSSNMVNHSRLKHRTISEHILLRYQNLDKVRAIVDEGNALLERRDDIGYFVFRFDSFGDSALKLYIYAWAQTTPNVGFLPYAEFMRIKEEVLLAIADIARRHGCDLLLPASNIYLRDGWQPSGSGPAMDGYTEPRLEQR